MRWFAPTTFPVGIMHEIGAEGKFGGVNRALARVGRGGSIGRGIDFAAALLALWARRPEGGARELASLGSNQLPSDALWRAVPDRDW